jgi:hypothetical protein
VELVQKPNHELNGFSLCADREFLFRLGGDCLQSREGSGGGRGSGGARSAEAEEGYLYELLWRDDALEVVSRPDLPHDLSKLLDERATGCGVSSWVEEELSERLDMREGMESDVDVVRVGEIVQADETREIGDTVDITS